MIPESLSLPVTVIRDAFISYRDYAVVDHRIARSLATQFGITTFILPCKLETIFYLEEGVKPDLVHLWHYDRWVSSNEKYYADKARSEAYRQAMYAKVAEDSKREETLRPIRERIRNELYILNPELIDKYANHILKGGEEAFQHIKSLLTEV